jgi:hypothetical protein
MSSHTTETSPTPKAADLSPITGAAAGVIAESNAVTDSAGAPAIVSGGAAPELTDDEQQDPARPGAPRARTRSAGLSYKFQRLRERLRAAVASGELSGKLPGERALAKRFHVNAKTLSKALTDLAAEGLLDRSIGRGTYVKGAAPAPATPARWLVLCDVTPGAATAEPTEPTHPRPDATVSAGTLCLLDHLRRFNPDLQVAGDVSAMRPSFLNGFGAVIDAATSTPESFLRDLVVRGVPVVAVGREARTYSMHAVLVDAALGAARLTRELILAGHRRLAAVDDGGGATVVQAVRVAAERSAPDATVDACDPGEVAALVEHGVTAFVCGSPRAALRVGSQLRRLGADVPGGVSLAAVGCRCGDADCDSCGGCPCSGYYVDCAQIADAVAQLLADAPARPATLWLAGQYVDRGTTGAGGFAPELTLPAGRADRTRVGALV